VSSERNLEESTPLELEDEPEEAELEDDDDDDVPLAGDESSTSLDELLARRADLARTTGEPEDGIEHMLAVVPERDASAGEALAGRVIPVKRTSEFVCSRCRLVKARSQLADPARILCRDCA